MELGLTKLHAMAEVWQEDSGAAESFTLEEIETLLHNLEQALHPGQASFVVGVYEHTIQPNATGSDFRRLLLSFQSAVKAEYKARLIAKKKPEAPTKRPQQLDIAIFYRTLEKEELYPRSGSYTPNKTAWCSEISDRHGGLSAGNFQRIYNATQVEMPFDDMVKKIGQEKVSILISELPEKYSTPARVKLEAAMARL